MDSERGYRGAMPAVPLEPLRSRDPRDVGEFRLLGRLGGGGMGVAFLAEGQGQWAVVKIIRSELADSTDFQARLRRELEAMSRAAGPRTAQVLAEGVDEDPSWFAMEFIPGVTLARQVSDSGPVDRGKLYAFARELAEVLADVHQAGVIHRDLKPANIMMSPTGPRLIDFGIAAFQGGTQLTATGSVMGTSGWLAPEQITGDPVSTATDVHAWALCILFAATGRQPIEADSSGAAMYLILETTPEIPVFVEDPLRVLLESALAKDPSRRPTVDRILHELGSRYVVGAPNEAPQPSTLPIPDAEQLTQRASTHEAPPPPRPIAASGRPRKRARTAGILAAVALVIVGVAGFVLASAGENQTTDQAAAEQTAESASAASQTASEPAVESTPTAEEIPEPQPIYATTVDYSNERIPDRVFDNTLDWSFDVCVADLEFLKPANLDKIQVREGAGGPLVDISAKGVQGGRCQASEVNLTFDSNEPVPPVESIGTGWSACRPYRVVLPETTNFARSTIDFCVRTRAEPS